MRKAEAALASARRNLQAREADASVISLGARH
jgi:hypothetical protein